MSSKHEPQEKDIRPYSSGELVILYGISHRTLRNWLLPFMAEIGKKRGRFFTVKQIELIFAKLGFPKDIDET